MLTPDQNLNGMEILLTLAFLQADPAKILQKNYDPGFRIKGVKLSIEIPGFSTSQKGPESGICLQGDGFWYFGH